MARKKKKPNYISIVIWMITMFLFGLLTYEIYNANVLPNKYYIFFAIIFILFIALFILFILNKRTKKIILIILNIIFIIIIYGCFFGYNKLSEVMNFLNENLGAKYETNIYYIIVNKESEYKENKDIKGKTIKLVDELNDKDILEKNINKKVEVEFEYVNNITVFFEELKDNKELILFVNSGTYDAMNENDEMIKSETPFSSYSKILDTIEIQLRQENTETGLDVTIDPFVVYLSGIDTRSGKLPTKSLSDVNLLVAVNPKTHQILMVNTPRDYYVKINGVGKEDKLTHAGIIGGYRTSMATLEDLYEIKVDYYVRVNFNAVIKLVDAIGGITITSDLNKTYKTLHGNNCIIKPGENKLNGDCALGFSRERYAYKDGDNQRGRNQEQVLSKVIEKVTTSKTILSKSSELLEAMSGTFNTNFTTDEITSLVKDQLDTMKGWNIDTYNVTGTDSYSYGYLYPNNKLYVMMPNMDMVKIAREKLNAFEK